MTAAQALARIRAEQPVHVVVEDVEFLADMGCRWGEVEQRTGFGRDTIETHLARHGRKDLAAKISRSPVGGLW